MTVAGCDRAGWQADTGRAGLAVLAAGRAVVAAPAVTALSLIFLTPQPGASPLALPYVSAVTPGTGFTISSLSLLDTAAVAWFVIEAG